MTARSPSPVHLQDLCIAVGAVALALGVALAGAASAEEAADRGRPNKAADKQVYGERRDDVGVTHEFFGAAAVVEKARKAQAYAGERLKQAYNGEAS